MIVHRFFCWVQVVFVAGHTSHFAMRHVTCFVVSHLTPVCCESPDTRLGANINAEKSTFPCFVEHGEAVDYGAIETFY